MRLNSEPKKGKPSIIYVFALETFQNLGLTFVRALWMEITFLESQ